MPIPAKAAAAGSGKQQEDANLTTFGFDAA